MATRTSLTNSFGPPVNLGPGINSESDDGGPAISADGLTLVFVSYRSGFGGPGDLSISTRTDIRASWEPARLMPETVNSSAIEVTPALSDDGLTLVYMSNRNGQGALWITRRTDRADEFGPPLIIQRLVDEGIAAIPAFPRTVSRSSSTSTRMASSRARPSCGKPASNRCPFSDWAALAARRRDKCNP